VFAYVGRNRNLKYDVNVKRQSLHLPKKIGPRNAKNIDSCTCQESNWVPPATNQCALPLDHVIRKKSNVMGKMKIWVDTLFCGVF
jgi:hypothetical protein